MLINESRANIITMIELWVYKTGNAPSSMLRVIDCDEGFKVGVIDYIDLENELVTKEDGHTEEDAKKVRQRILEKVDVRKRPQGRPRVPNKRVIMTMRLKPQVKEWLESQELSGPKIIENYVDFKRAKIAREKKKKEQLGVDLSE
jgi:hypothetical protein